VCRCSLLSDYACYVLPNAHKCTLGGHKGNVKCVEFVGEEGNLIASGASDNTVRLWSAEDGKCTRVLSGHTSRVWSVASSRAGHLLVTASGDATAAVRALGSSVGAIMLLTKSQTDLRYQG
jgi:WD40 repeat protein